MKKLKAPTYIANAIKRYVTACDELAVMFLGQLGLSDRKDYDWWWIEEPSGGILAFNAGEMFLNVEDVIRVIEAAMDYDSFMEWYGQWIDYDFDTGERKPHRINLRSWLMGARPDE